jgi:hypothetical protein
MKELANLNTKLDRLISAMEGGSKPAVKAVSAPEAKTETKKAPVAKKTVKAVAKKVVAKAPAKKVATKKPVAKKKSK